MFSVISLTLFVFVVLWFSSPLLGLARVAGYMFAFIFSFPPTFFSFFSFFFLFFLFFLFAVISVDVSGFDNGRDAARGLEWLF